MEDKPIRVLSNSGTYVSEDIIQQCFEEGIIHHVNKEMCGNGFSTGFLSLKPEFNKTDILICPNKSVVIDKQEEVSLDRTKPLKEQLYKDLRVGFLYKESTDSLNSLDKYDKIVCVADSFNKHHNTILERYNIGKILIDEQHTVEQSISFRTPTMFNLPINLSKFKRAKITYVTASPNLHNKTTIHVKNELLKESKIHLSRNVNKSFERLVNRIIEGENVFIFTNDSTIVTRICMMCKRFDINYKGGDSLKSSLIRKGQFVFDTSSNITICSSAAYEGWSSKVENGSAFLFVSYDTPQNSMLGSNIYQAINRLRKGAIHSELVFFEDKETPKLYPNLKDIMEYFSNLKTPDHTT